MRMSHFHAALIGSAFALAAFGAEAQTFSVVHDFAGAPSDGSYTANNVVFGSGGDLFGASNLGGSNNAGIIYEIARNGTETVLYSFVAGSDGYDPNGSVTLDASGNIYGTATFGGNSSCLNGCGVLYKLTAHGTYKVLHRFNPSNDGHWPVGTLVRDKKGNFFGVTGNGGANQGGTVYEYSAKGKFTVLHAFGGSDGFQPEGSLTEDTAGNLYGVTNSGGTDQYGTVFQLAPDGTLTTLYSFTGGNDGGYPTGGVERDSAGNLYGATNLAGNGSTPYGTVYMLTPGGTLTTLYAFQGSTDGGYPYGSVLLVHGKLYGTTTWGGGSDYGVVYEVDPANSTEAVLHSFAGSDGSTPQSGLTRKHSRLYGTTSGGGTDNYGVVYSLKSK